MKQILKRINFPTFPKTSKITSVQSIEKQVRAAWKYSLQLEFSVRNLRGWNFLNKVEPHKKDGEYAWGATNSNTTGEELREKQQVSCLAMFCALDPQWTLGIQEFYIFSYINIHMMKLNL